MKHQLALKFARFGAQVLELRELHWQLGAGLLTGSALVGPTRKQADLEANGLEAEAVLKTLGLAANAVRGRLNARLHFEEDGRARQGQLQGSFVDGVVPTLGAVHAEFSATALDSELEGQAALSLPELGRGKLSAHAALGKAPLTVDSLSAMLGEVRLDVSDVELREVGRRWLPAATVTLSGLVDGSVRLAKLDERAPGELQL